MQVEFHRFLISFFGLVQDVSNLMRPTALQGYLRIDQGQSGQEYASPVYYNQLDILAGETTTVQIVKKSISPCAMRIFTPTPPPDHPIHKLVPRAEDGVALSALDTSSCVSET
jgi:hypothetical protein